MDAATVHSRLYFSPDLDRISLDHCRRIEITARQSQIRRASSTQKSSILITNFLPNFLFFLHPNYFLVSSIDVIIVFFFILLFYVWLIHFINKKYILKRKVKYGNLIYFKKSLTNCLVTASRKTTFIEESDAAKLNAIKTKSIQKIPIQSRSNFQVHKMVTRARANLSKQCNLSETLIKYFKGLECKWIKHIYGYVLTPYMRF